MVNLSVEGLKTGYGSSEVLRNLTFGVDEGDFIGVIGPNGSGKSTLIRAITNILKAWEGTVQLDGDPVSQLKRREIAKRVATVPQDTFISFPYSAWEIVLMGRTPYLGKFENPDTKDKRVAKKAMRSTGTLRFKERSVEDLSGGELQRVIVARALTQEPELLLLDEATSHLDIGHKKEVMDTIKEKNESENLSVVSIHHNLNLAARYCEKILLLDEGRKHAFGKPQDVLTSSHLRAVYGIEAEVHENPKDGTLYVSPMDKNVSSKSKGKNVHVICGGGSARTILRDLVEEGYEVTTGVLNVMDSDLEKAEFLDIEAVTEAPFSSISRRSHEKNLEMIKDADILIVTDFPVGQGNKKNLEAVKECVKDHDKKIILIDPGNIEERDYTDGGVASQIYDEITQREEVHSVDSSENILKML